jgi:hypothetical protein
VSNRFTKMIANESTRSRLQRRLNVVLFDEEWEYLVDDGKVRRSQDIEELAGEAQRLRRLRREPIFERSADRVHMLGVPSVPARKEAVSLLLAESAVSREDVRRFRKVRLGEILLKQDKVESWVKSQVEADGPRTLWLSVGLPAGREIVDEEGQPVLKPGIRIDKLEHWSTDIRLLDYGVPSDSWVRRVPTCASGVLEELRQLSDRLAAEYGWQSGQASVFVLTGATPLIDLSVTDYVINNKYPPASRLHLKLDPALSPAQVAKIYRQSRAQLLRTRYRNLSVKHTTLAAFSALRDQKERIADLRMAWNKKYPKWKYEEDRNFWRDVNKAKKRLLTLPIGIEGLFGRS